LSVAVAAVALSATGCGGEKRAVKTDAREQPPTTVGPGNPAFTTTTFETNPTGPGNPTYFKKKLEERECESVKAATSTVLAVSQNTKELTEAHLYHALADACLGNDARAELDQVEASRALLSEDSMIILDGVKTKGVPHGAGQVQALLPTRTVTEQP
jgi:hypothetical protein